MTDQTPPKNAALVTGGAKRLGRAFIEALAADGHDVIIHYNSSSDEAEALAAELSESGVKAITLGADLSQPEEAAGLIARANEALGPVGVLVNSASVFEQDQLEDLGADSFHRHMTANTPVSGAFDQGAGRAGAGAGLRGQCARLQALQSQRGLFLLHALKSRAENHDGDAGEVSGAQSASERHRAGADAAERASFRSRVRAGP